MGRHSHLTIEEREDVMCLRGQGRGVSEIARETHGGKSAVSGELARSSCAASTVRPWYRASTAQRRHEARREACRKPRPPDDPEGLELARGHVLEGRWSPGQLEGRIRLERPGLVVSDTTICREIASGRPGRCMGGRRASARLGRGGGRRKRRDGSEPRGKIKVSHELSERPAEAGARSRVGDWEGDAVAGRAGGARPVTMVDRMSGCLAGRKPPPKRRGDVGKATVAAMRGRAVEAVTPDRGKEFAEHAELARGLGVECYFRPPHHPWDRGTNENTNGLPRQHFPKGCDLDAVADGEVERVYDELNRRPRKRLGYLTPYEVYRSASLHLL